MADPQTLQESNLVVEHLSDDVDEFKKTVLATLEKILAQTTKTNGRVNRLEGWKAGVLWAGVGILVVGAYALRVYDVNQENKMQKLVASEVAIQVKDMPALVVDQLEEKYVIEIK